MGNTTENLLCFGINIGKLKRERVQIIHRVFKRVFFLQMAHATIRVSLLLNV